MKDPTEDHPAWSQDVVRESDFVTAEALGEQKHKVEDVLFSPEAGQRDFEQHRCYGHPLNRWEQAILVLRGGRLALPPLAASWTASFRWTFLPWVQCVAETELTK